MKVAQTGMPVPAGNIGWRITRASTDALHAADLGIERDGPFRVIPVTLENRLAIRAGSNLLLVRPDGKTASVVQERDAVRPVNVERASDEVPTRNGLHVFPPFAAVAAAGAVVPQRKEAVCVDFDLLLVTFCMC